MSSGESWGYDMSRLPPISCASASLAESGDSPKRVSMSFGTGEKSYVVWSTYPGRARAEMIRAGT